MRGNVVRLGVSGSRRLPNLVARPVSGRCIQGRTDITKNVLLSQDQPFGVMARLGIGCRGRTVLPFGGRRIPSYFSPMTDYLIPISDYLIEALPWINW